MRVKFKEVRDALTRELRIYRLILKHEWTPRITRWSLGVAVAYALSPIDLIPDWIPIIGHLDDVLIVPLIVWLSLRFVPAEVVSECRARAGESDGDGQSEPTRSRGAALRALRCAQWAASVIGQRTRG